MVRKFAFFIVLILAMLSCSLFPQATSTPPAISGEDQVSSPGGDAQIQAQASATPRPVVTATPVVAHIDTALPLDQYLPSAPFVVTFDQPMDTASAQPVLYTYPWVDGELAWSEDNTRLSFTPRSGFIPERDYQIVLNDDLKSVAGGSLKEKALWELRALPAPRVLEHSPDATRLLDRHPEIRITFDSQMTSESLEKAFAIQPALPHTLVVDEKTVTVQLDQALTPGVRYHFTLDSNAKDTRGVPLSTEYRWEYSLPNLVESVTTDSYYQGPDRIVLNLNYALRQDDLKACSAYHRLWMGNGSG